jgi:hypothetical protein
MNALLAIAAICVEVFNAWSLCTVQYYTPPFVTWALEAGWEIAGNDLDVYGLPNCWTLKPRQDLGFPIFDERWSFCVDPFYRPGVDQGTLIYPHDYPIPFP